MYGLLKFIVSLMRAFIALLDHNKNDLRHAPISIRYTFSILLASFWCLAFGLWAGELYYIGYNMMGHVAVVTMAFVTWAVLKSTKRIYSREHTDQYLRAPDHSSRCDELSDEQRAELAKRLG